ncbi:MAG TPA: ABC transporter permease [Thermoanaerobaculia bacterium]|nr:ABC transporter permease [Thermoanaerobaculia bacterium]
METFRIAAEALRRHLLRSFLTLLGVIIGVMTVVAVVAVISGLNNYVSTQLFNLSPDVFIATQFGIITSQEEFLEAVKRKRLDMTDLRAVREHCKTCGVVSAQASDRMSIRRNGRQLGGVVVFGGSANLADTKNVDIDAGRFFTASEDMHGAPVAVIGTDVRDELFGRLDPVGRTLKANGYNLTVIGVLKKQGSILGQNQDNQMYIPLSTFAKNFGTRRSIGIGIRPLKGIAGMNECMDEVRVILRSRRHTAFRAKDPFSFVTAEALQAVWRSISASSFALMTFISGISLVVGGIVITNIMLVSVVERTREIGIRRAIGARRGDILRQFLTEAALLSFIGGLLGVLLGYAISKGISSAFPLPTLVKPSLVISGLSIAVVTGLIAGVFPAVKAARLPPVEALRYE